MIEVIHFLTSGTVKSVMFPRGGDEGECSRRVRFTTPACFSIIHVMGNGNSRRKVERPVTDRRLSFDTARLRVMQLADETLPKTTLPVEIRAPPEMRAEFDAVARESIMFERFSPTSLLHYSVRTDGSPVLRISGTLKLKDNYH